MTGRMFEFITKCWNPLGGECWYRCSYCWARALAKKHDMKKYQGEPRLYQRELEREFKPDDFVFVCDMLDLFGDWVPSAEVIKVILSKIGHSPATFLLLTKNPKRYLELLDFLPKNVVLGCTIESDRNYPGLSYAGSQLSRLDWMAELSDVTENRLFISVEPVLDFTETLFTHLLLRIRPWAVAVGMDNYANHLPEPPLAKTMELIGALERAGMTVFRKSLREAWNV